MSNCELSFNGYDDKLLTIKQNIQFWKEVKIYRQKMKKSVSNKKYEEKIKKINSLEK